MKRNYKIRSASVDPHEYSIFLIPSNKIYLKNKLAQGKLFVKYNHGKYYIINVFFKYSKKYFSYRDKNNINQYWEFENDGCIRSKVCDILKCIFYRIWLI